MSAVGERSPLFVGYFCKESEENTCEYVIFAVTFTTVSTSMAVTRSKLLRGGGGGGG